MITAGLKDAFRSGGDLESVDELHSCDLGPVFAPHGGDHRAHILREGRLCRGEPYGAGPGILDHHESRRCM